MRLFDKDSHHRPVKTTSARNASIFVATFCVLSIFVARTLGWLSASWQKRNFTLWSFSSSNRGIIGSCRMKFRSDLCFVSMLRSAVVLWLEIVRHLCGELVTLACIQRKCFEFELYSNNYSPLEFEIRPWCVDLPSLRQGFSVFAEFGEVWNRSLVGRYSESMREREFSCTRPIFRLESKIIQRRPFVQASNDLIVSLC